MLAKRLLATLPLFNEAGSSIIPSKEQLEKAPPPIFTNCAGNLIVLIVLFPLKALAGMVVLESFSIFSSSSLDI